MQMRLISVTKGSGPSQKGYDVCSTSDTLCALLLDVVHALFVFWIVCCGRQELREKHRLDRFVLGST